MYLSLVPSVLSLVVGVLSAVSSLIAVIASGKYVDQHLHYWSGNLFQKHVIIISTIIPVYSLLSWFCVLFPDSSIYILFFIDTYEVLAIYHFMELMKAYLGGYNAAVRKIRAQPPVPVLCFTIHPHEGTLRSISFCVYQFLLVKPCLSFMLALLEHFELVKHELSLTSPFLYISAIKGMSLAVAMIALLVFYRLSRPSLRSYNIITKFLIVKLIIFLNVIQTFIFSNLAARQLIPPSDGMTSGQRAFRLLYFLICVEMAVLAFVFPRAFPSDEKMVKREEGDDTNNNETFSSIGLESTSHILTPPSISIDVHN